MIGIILAGGAAVAVTGYGLSRYKRRRRLKRKYNRWLDQRQGSGIIDGVADVGSDLLWLQFMNDTAGGTDFRVIDNFEGGGGSFGGGGASGSWEGEGGSTGGGGASAGWEAASLSSAASDSDWTDYIPDLPEISLPDIDLSGIEFPDIDIDLS